MYGQSMLDQERAAGASLLVPLAGISGDSPELADRQSPRECRVLWRTSCSVPSREINNHAVDTNVEAVATSRSLWCTFRGGHVQQRLASTTLHVCSKTAWLRPWRTSKRRVKSRILWKPLLQHLSDPWVQSQFHRQAVKIFQAPSDSASRGRHTAVEERYSQIAMPLFASCPL